ncbi:endonuclease domain-containing protein [Bifidobacterium simiarum]|uniref:endonuclease domain-containing protein n=1 Tax=Bifidobacterium simiarum TaxID=2045441 RepID=UPI001BDC4764|nr:endonuclease domain-containing protein [Bifidobacterium simiarum]MBT1166068.1 endonuclease domain-containing protein [Bifidobacterium simiarum]
MPNLTPYAQRLRKTMTPEERKLWFEFLRPLPFTVNRQKVIGPYIVDFYCAAARLVIEIDGSQHYRVLGKQADEQRDAFLHRRDLKIVRYPNNAVNYHFEAVCSDIARRIREQMNDARGFPSRGSWQPKG